MATALRDWGCALAGAVVLHFGIVLLLMNDSPGVGAHSQGIGGIEIGLGSAGGASSAAGNQSETTEDTHVEARPEPAAREKAADAVQQARLDKPAEFSLTNAALETPQPAEDSPAKVPALVKTVPDYAAEAEEIAENKPVEAGGAMRSAAEPEADGIDLAGSGPDTKSRSGDGMSGGGGSGFVSSYIATLQAWIEKHKTYPFRAKSKRQQGVVLLYFVIDRAGRVLDHRIEESSTYRLLDEEAIEMLKRAQPFPPFSDDIRDDRLEVIVPIQFFLS